MWSKIAHSILRYRIPLMVLILLITIFMGYHAQNVKWSFNLVKTVPDTDPDMRFFNDFKKTFGQDGNLLAFGIRDSSLFELEKFNQFYDLTQELKNQKGVRGVLGLANLQILEKNESKRKFDFRKQFTEKPNSQEALDSLLNFANNLKFYSGQLINQNTGATALLITVDNDIFNSKQRTELMNGIVNAGKNFTKQTGIKIHYAGLPYVRTMSTIKVKRELNMFLIASLCITGLILFVFFRSFKAVIFPLIIIGVIVVWVMGTLSLLDYKITLLTGLIPPIIVVIGIPNSVYMLNKYHHEFAKHGDKMKALSRIIRKIGVVTFITNLTTAVGFFVLISTKISVLMEFGIVAGINVMATFLVSIILIPAVFSLYKPPSERHLKHLNFKFIDFFILKINEIVFKKRKLIFVITTVLVAISIVGLLKIKATSYMVDDLPESSDIRKDLKFFEDNFTGIMPLELIVDTGVKKGAQRLANLKKVEQLETFIESMDEVSQPVSIISFTKAARQAFYNHNPAFYGLPTKRDAAYIMKYLKGGNEQNLSKSFIDSTGRKIRVSLKVADIGSNKMDSLITQVIQPKINEIFEGSKLKADITGTMLMFIKGNRFLIKNLIISMFIAFGIIALIMGLLFRNVRMIIVSVIPNIIPLLITAGIMGYFGIPLKPSTALIFSIAFGISVDDSIHFLAKYRQELKMHNFDIRKAINISIKETGASMIYTSIILFFGFIIFVFSGFGGTIALGLLTSITLFFAMITNVVVLPALILQFDSRKNEQNIHPNIDDLPELAEGIDKE